MRHHPKVGSGLWAKKFSACEKKKAYLSESDAKSVAVRQQKKTGVQLKVYACPFSPHWHIAHSLSSTSSGPKIFCASCKMMILQNKWDKHYKLCSNGVSLPLDHQSKNHP